jgi:hypothetical protein
MPSQLRFGLFGIAGLVCSLTSLPAAAWIETSVVSDAVSVEVDRNGQAIVSHDLWMKIRGGPLKGTELDGIDSDAEPLPDAQVSKVSSGSRSGEGKALLLSRGEDDTLRIEVEDNAGLRNGTYAFRFKYRTDLRQRSRVALRGSWAELGWIGPRYRAGLDVAKVTFRLPYSTTAPRLPETDPGIDELSRGELPTAAMLSTLRRGADVDELELVRPHIAKGEPVLWRIWAAPASFPWLSEPKRDAPGALVKVTTSPRSPLGRGLALLLSTLVAVGSAAAVLAKHRAVSLMSTRQDCTARPLFALGPHLRAAASGLLLAAALLLSVRFDTPSCAAVAYLMALGCMTYRRPLWPRNLRGPGRWLPIHRDEAFRPEPRVVVGRFLDASTVEGRGVLTIWSFATLSAALSTFRTQPYLALLTLMATVIPWPLLLTGRSSELPSSVRARAHRELEKIHRRLLRDGRLRVHPIARFGEGDSEPDEIRLKLSANTVDPGLIGLEIAVNGASSLAQPCLLVRVQEGSGTHQRYSSVWSFTRGRTAMERVGIFAPAVAARTRIIRLLYTLLVDHDKSEVNRNAAGSPPVSDASKVDYGVSRSNPASSPRRSPGNCSSTSKPSRASVPTHATRAA